MIKLASMLMLQGTLNIIQITYLITGHDFFSSTCQQQRQVERPARLVRLLVKLPLKPTKLEPKKAQTVH